MIIGNGRYSLGIFCEWCGWRYRNCSCTGKSARPHPKRCVRCTRWVCDVDCRTARALEDQRAQMVRAA